MPKSACALLVYGKRGNLRWRLLVPPLTATAAHQVEGSNVYNDNWVLEHVPGTPYSEPSGDACDHYHRYRQDIALLAEQGFTLYRFSLEWSRIEPEEGEFSLPTTTRGGWPMSSVRCAVSPPAWMKRPRVYNSGMLRWEPEILDAYALYLLRFVQAYQAEGLPVHQLHVQNEPNSEQKFPSCVWTGERMRDFIRDYLGPHFREDCVACEIWAGTIERPDYDAWAHTILLDPRARSFVSGVGYQWAGKGAVQRTHQSWPALRLLQTECECGDGTNTWDYAHYVFTLLHHYLSNGANGFVYWNMVLPPGGRSTWGLSGVGF